MANRDILTTKLTHAARHSDLVSRPRLAAPFDHEPFNRLTLVCAQAGYGKTTLVSSWVRASAESVAWLSLDRDDNDSGRFLAHLVASIRIQVPDFEVELTRILQSRNPPPIRSLMTRFVNAAAGVGRRLIIVLDDYHVISENEVHDALLFLLDHQPANLHIIVTTREEPPFSVARLHSHGRLARFTERDLCFTAQEAEEFFSRAMKVQVSADQSEALRNRTEGWVAGMQMAALSLAKGQSKADFIAEFSGNERHVIDFLLDEVLSSQAESIQLFLMRTSILEQFNAELCHAVTGEPDSQNVLLNLERSHMFLVPLDSNREWYRYHHLFSDLLQSRLNKVDPEQARELHTLAAQWHSANRLPADALRHAHAAQDKDLIARILDQHAVSMFSRGEVRTVATWLKLLPEPVTAQYPRLALIAAFNIYFQPIPDVALAERYLAVIDRALGEIRGSPKVVQDMMGKVAVVRGYQARFAGHANISLECFSMAGELLRNDDVFYDIAQINLGILHGAAGRLDEATAIFSRYSELREEQPNLWITMSAIFGLSRIQLMRGNLLVAQSICIEGLRQFRDKDLQDMPVCSMPHLQLAEIAYIQNRIDDAEEQARRAVELAKAGGMELNRGCSEVLLVRVALARGDQASLDLQYEQRLLGFWASVSLIFPQLSGYLAQLWLAQGRVGDLAARFALRGIDSRSIRPEWEMESLVLARLLLRQRRAGEAFDLLSRLLLNAEREKRHGASIEILILQALVRQVEDNVKSAAAFLCQALSLAETDGWLRPFIDAGIDVRSLLLKMEVPPKLAGFADKIIAAFDAASAGAQEAERPIAFLSTKEERVAQLLVAGLSNAEIAEKLFVSPNTVKFHIKGLYRKLGVKKRFDAIQKLRGQGGQ